MVNDFNLNLGLHRRGASPSRGAAALQERHCQCSRKSNFSRSSLSCWVPRMVPVHAAEREDVRKVINLVTSVKMPFPESLARNRSKTERVWLERAGMTAGCIRIEDRRWCYEFIAPEGNRAEMLRIRSEPSRGVFIGALFHYMVDFDLDGLIDVGSTTRIERSISAAGDPDSRRDSVLSSQHEAGRIDPQASIRRCTTRAFRSRCDTSASNSGQPSFYPSSRVEPSRPIAQWAVVTRRAGFRPPAEPSPRPRERRQWKRLRRSEARAGSPKRTTRRPQPGQRRRVGRHGLRHC